MVKSAPHNVARSTGSITPAIATARKAARLAAEVKNAAEVEMLKNEIEEAVAAGDHVYASAVYSIYKTVSKNAAFGKSREIQLIENGFVYHSTHSVLWKLEAEANRIRKDFAAFAVYKNVNGTHLYVLSLKGV